MIKILTKYLPGEKVYTITQVPFRKKTICELCEGEGAVRYKKHLIKCPSCKGEDVFFETKFRVWEVVEFPQKISAINVKYLGENKYKVAYKINGNKKAEENIFKTFEEAYDRCCELNKVLNYNPISKDRVQNETNEIIIDSKFDLNDLVYATLPKNYSYEEDDLKNNPFEVSEIRATVGLDNIEVRYKIDMGLKLVNRAENNVFKTYDELSNRMKELELASVLGIENEEL